MKIKKRFISIITMIFIMVSVFCCPVFADYESPDFGQGFTNEYREQGKATSIISLFLARQGVFCDTSLFVDQGDIGKAKGYSSLILNKIHGASNDLYNRIIDDNETNIVFRGGKAIVNFGSSWIDDTAPAGMPTNMDDFYTFLFGDNSLTGDPVSATIATPYTITFNGEEVIPWTSYQNIVSMYDKRYNASWVKSRGTYVLPAGGNYLQYWADLGGANGEQNKQKQNFMFVNNSGNIETISTNYVVYSRQANNATYGPIRDINYRGTTTNANDLSMWYANEDNTVSSAFAYLPVISADGYMTVWYYGYVYKGVFIPPNWHNHNFVYMCLKTTSSKPKHNDTGSMEFDAPQGIQYNIDASSTYVIENVNSYDDIINNYLNGTLNVHKNYTDPSTWDTGTSGTATPDGDGGFNIDLGNFHLPDLNIDWSLSGISEKFPFSIPFDLVAFYTILNVEPETPELEGTLEFSLLGTDISWDYDFDLHDFDDFAALARNIEFVGFCILLIFATRNVLR